MTLGRWATSVAHRWEAATLVSVGGRLGCCAEAELDCRWIWAGCQTD